MDLIFKNEGAELLQKNKDDLMYLQFPSINNTGICRHLFSTRTGGVSTGDLESMNLSYERGDLKENVDENYRRIAKVLGVEIDQFVLSHQTHTTNVRLVTKEDCGKGIIKDRDYSDVDGFICNESGIVLTTIFADCVPLYFVDPVKKAIGLSHSGWKGTVGKMGKLTVEKMQECFGTVASDVIACIGPSICGDCYEVSSDVYEQFEMIFKKAENIDKIIKNKNEKTKKADLNLWEANLAVLLEAGLKRENITISNLCTCCNSKILFSHRASKGKRGNLAAFLMLN